MTTTTQTSNVFPYNFQLFIEKIKKHRFYFIRMATNQYVVADHLNTLEERVRELLSMEGMSERDIFYTLATELTSNLSSYQRVKYMEKAHHLQPTTQSANYLAKNALEKEQYSKAASYLENIENPTVESHLIYAKYYEFTNEVDKQQEHLDFAFSLDPLNPQVLYDRGFFYYNKIKKSIEANEDYLRTDYQDAFLCIEQYVKPYLEKVKHRVRQLDNKLNFKSEDYIFIPYIHLLLIGKKKKEAKQLMKTLFKLYPYKTPAQIDVVLKQHLVIEFAPDLTEEDLVEYRRLSKNFLYELIGTLYYDSAILSLLKDKPLKAIKKLTFATQLMPHYNEWRELLEQVQDKPKKAKKLAKKVLTAPLSSVDTMNHLHKELLEFKKQCARLAEVEKRRKNEIKRLEEAYRLAEESRDRLEQYYNELLEQEKARYEFVYGDILNEEKAIQYIVEQISSEQYEKLKSFDELCQKRLERDFRNKDVLFILPIHQQLLQAETFYNCIMELGITNKLDNTVLVESYFKTIEILLAKMIGEISYESILYTKSEHIEKNKRIIGIDDRYYLECTLGNYAHYIKNSKEYDEENVEPVRAHIDKKELYKACQEFIKIRNHYSHKQPLPFNDVEDVRQIFYKLLKQLLEAFIDIPQSYWMNKGIIKSEN